MPAISDLGRYADELLEDGQWHDYYVIVAKLAARVQPGRAVRRAETQRITALKTHHGGRDNVPPRRQSVDVADLVRIGSRHIAKQALSSKRFEIAPHGRVPAGQRKYVRRRPT